MTIKNTKGRGKTEFCTGQRRLDAIRRKGAIVCMELVFCVDILVTTKQKSRLETHYIKEEMEGKNCRIPQN